MGLVLFLVFLASSWPQTLPGTQVGRPPKDGAGWSSRAPLVEVQVSAAGRMRAQDAARTKAGAGGQGQDTCAIS